jgi:hypothetical protein
MKKYIVSYYDDECIKRSIVVEANNEEEAKSIGWQVFPEAESLYVSEVQNG